MRGERDFNYELGAAIRKSKPAWKKSVFVEETRLLRESRGLQVDILIAGRDAPPVAIEPSYAKGDADRDAAERLGKHYARNGDEIKTAIAVEIDEGQRRTRRLTRRHTIRYAVHQKAPGGGSRRFPASGFIEGSYLDIARLASSASVPREDAEGVAREVCALVNAAAAKLGDSIPQSHLERISRTLYQRSALTGLRTTALLWLNSMLVQRMLFGGVHAIPPLSPVPSRCVDAWSRIREINWKAIFEPAILILDDVRKASPGPAAESLKMLQEAVEIIDAARMGGGISIGAELFPLLADDRKESAAFYTQAPAAEFLAAATIKFDMANWGDPDLFDGFRITDLSCGTGTLLRFGYKQVRTYHEQAGGTEETLERLHRAALERGICGADVSPIASHLTSTSLAVMSKQPYGETNIGWVGAGGRDRTGSIEYLATSAVQDLLAKEFGMAAGQDGDARRPRGRRRSAASEGDGNDGDAMPEWAADRPPRPVVARDEDSDVVLMNPPYSRTRGGQSAFDISGLSDVERKACQKRWGKLIQGEPCDKRAGMAATFLCIARRKARPGGRIGLVLPRTAAFADTWSRTRDMVETWFEDVTVVAVAGGKALGRNALSAETHMEEMFLIATRRKNRGSRSPIRCVTLHEPLTRVGEAAEIARAVAGGPGDGPIMLGLGEIGVSHMFKPSDDGGGAPWSAVGSLGDALEMIKNGLLDGRLLCTDGAEASAFKMTTIGELFDIGPTHHLVGHIAGNEPIGAFTFTPVAGATDAAGRHRAMWSADSKTQRSMLALPTHKGAVHDEARAEAMWGRRTTLFYQRNMRWTSQAVVSVTTRSGAMGGSAWTGLSHDDERVKKAFALWANSVYGMVTYWATGQRTQHGRSRMQVNAIGGVRCPDFAALGDAALDRAAGDFDIIVGEGGGQRNEAGLHGRGGSRARQDKRRRVGNAVRPRVRSRGACQAVVRRAERDEDARKREEAARRGMLASDRRAC